MDGFRETLELWVADSKFSFSSTTSFEIGSSDENSEFSLSVFLSVVVFLKYRNKFFDF
jgi:hypothetical protein